MRTNVDRAVRRAALHSQLYVVPSPAGAAEGGEPIEEIPIRSKGGKRWYDRLTAVARAIDAIDIESRQRRHLIRGWNTEGRARNLQALRIQVARLQGMIRVMEELDTEDAAKAAQQEERT